MLAYDVTFNLHKNDVTMVKKIGDKIFSISYASKNKSNHWNQNDHEIPTGVTFLTQGLAL